MRLGMAATLLIVSGCAWASFFPAEGPKVASNKASDSLFDHDKAAGLLQSFELLMAPAVSTHGGTLKVVLDDGDARVNAQATREGTTWSIVVYRGMLEHPKIDEAELGLVLCHELGHHLGGAPTAARDGWAACEGQADYWSTLNCFKAFRPNDDGQQVALRLTELYASMGHGASPSLECRDEQRPPRTQFGYPGPQCRLDTLVSGLVGGPRPACWFVR